MPNNNVIMYNFRIDTDVLKCDLVNICKGICLYTIFLTSNIYIMHVVDL